MKTTRTIRAMLIACLFIFYLIPITCFAWKGKVVGIADGDTITVFHYGHGEKIRLFGVDCPEKRQPFGKRAKQFTSSLVYGKMVKVDPITKDRYGRTVALVYVNNVLLNEELVRSGFAWIYDRYCHRNFCARWRDLQERARALKLGLWADDHSIAPWKYRHSRRHKNHGLTFSMYGNSHSLIHADKSSYKKPIIYRGNINSKIFHRPGCRHYNCSACSIEFSSREEAIAAGYTPCRRCSP